VIPYINLNQQLRILVVMAASASPFCDNIPKITELVYCFYTRTITNIYTRLYFIINWT